MTINRHYEINVQTHFSAAHHLRGYPGNCEKPHGHNWIVKSASNATIWTTLELGLTSVT